MLKVVSIQSLQLFDEKVVKIAGMRYIFHDISRSTLLYNILLSNSVPFADKLT